MNGATGTDAGPTGKNARCRVGDAHFALLAGTAGAVLLAITVGLFAVPGTTGLRLAGGASSAEALTGRIGARLGQAEPLSETGRPQEPGRRQRAGTGGEPPVPARRVHPNRALAYALASACSRSAIKSPAVSRPTERRT